MVGNTAIANSAPFLLSTGQFLSGVLSPSAGIRRFRKDVDQLEGPEEDDKSFQRSRKHGLHREVGRVRFAEPKRHGNSPHIY